MMNDLKRFKGRMKKPIGLCGSNDKTAGERLKPSEKLVFPNQLESEKPSMREIAEALHNCRDWKQEAIK